MEEGLNFNISVDNEDSLVEGLTVDRCDVNKSVKVDVVRNVGDTVCPWQLTPVIQTSSIATSPVNEDPRIPSNVT